MPCTLPTNRFKMISLPRSLVRKTASKRADINVSLSPIRHRAACATVQGKHLSLSLRTKPGWTTATSTIVLSRSFLAKMPPVRKASSKRQSNEQAQHSGYLSLINTTQSQPCHKNEGPPVLAGTIWRDNTIPGPDLAPAGTLAHCPAVIYPLPRGQVGLKAIPSCASHPANVCVEKP